MPSHTLRDSAAVGGGSEAPWLSDRLGREALRACQVWQSVWRGILSTWPISAIPEGLIWRRFAGAAGLMPIDGRGNLITLAGRDGAI